MALVLCPECRAEVSDRAAACPQCGYPLSAAASVPAHREEAKPPKPKAYITPRFALAATVVIGAVGTFAGALVSTGEEEAGFLAAMIVWASVIPLWWKARRAARAAAVPGAAEIERRVEERLSDAEERFRNQLAQVDDNARQMAELEERMEFTERLLTKYREGQLGP